MNINEAFPSRFWKTADLQGSEIQATISRVIIECVDDDTGERKPVLYFAGHEKGLVLIRTNSNAVADILGEETDAWHNQKLVLYPAKTDFKGRQVDCLRVRVLDPGAGQSAKVTPGQLKELIAGWKSKNPNSEVDGFRSWVEKNIGLDPELALSATAWKPEALSTAIELLNDEDVSF